MAFKIFNIGKANEEVTRLEVENEKLTKELAAVKENSTQIEIAAEKLKTDLVAVKAEAETLKADLLKKDSELAFEKGLSASLASERDTLKAAIANPEGEIQKAGAAKAAEITRGQGQPPLDNKPNGEVSGSGKPDFSKLHGLEKVIAVEKYEASQKTLNKK